jgi:transposase-like protein
LEFRNDVVAVARGRADSLSSIARDFGISEATLYNWLKRADINEGVRAGMTSAEAEQIRELKRRNKVLEQEVEILRRAGTYFARHLPPK